MSLGELKSARLANNLFSYLIHLVEYRDFGNNEAKLSGTLRNLIFKNHEFLEDCPGLLAMVTQEVSMFELEEEDKSIDLLYYNVISILLSKIIKNVKNNGFLLFLSSCIERDKKRNMYNSIFQLKVIEERYRVTWTQYRVFKFKSKVQN